MGTVEDKLSLLLNTKERIKNSIIRQGQPISESDPFSGYPDKIDAIQNGVQLPTLTNPGTAEDLLEGKELIDQDGNLITGTMPEAEPTSDAPAVIQFTGDGTGTYTALLDKSSYGYLLSCNWIMVTIGNQLTTTTGAYSLLYGRVPVNAGTTGSLIACLTGTGTSLANGIDVYSCNVVEETNGVRLSIATTGSPVFSQGMTYYIVGYKV